MKKQCDVITINQRIAKCAAKFLNIHTYHIYRHIDKKNNQSNPPSPYLARIIEFFEKYQLFYGLKKWSKLYFLEL